MATILCIETTTTNCSVALSVEGIVVSLKEKNDKNYSHAEKLHLFIEEVLVKSEITKDKLDAIAVSKGPGSYTGLRMCFSCKGLLFCFRNPSYFNSYTRSTSLSGKKYRWNYRAHVRC